jgi:hypothetical protein
MYHILPWQNFNWRKIILVTDKCRTVLRLKGKKSRLDVDLFKYWHHVTEAEIESKSAWSNFVYNFHDVVNVNCIVLFVAPSVNISWWGKLLAMSISSCWPHSYVYEGLTVNVTVLGLYPVIILNAIHFIQWQVSLQGGEKHHLWYCTSH